MNSNEGVADSSAPWNRGRWQIDRPETALEAERNLGNPSLASACTAY